MELEFKPNFSEIVKRMKRLWNLEQPIDRVPVKIILPVDGTRKGDGTFFGKFDEYLKYQEKVFKNQMQVMDDSIPTVDPQYGHALISGLCGAHIHAGAHTVWSTHVIKDFNQINGIKLNWDSELGKKVRDEYKKLLEWSKGRCVVANYEVEGVSDTMSALRGAQQLCMDFYDSADKVKQFANKVTDILIEFGKWNNENIGMKQELFSGIGVGWGLWMPENSMTFAEDATVMFSSELYNNFIKECDYRLSSAFNKTIIEVHKEGNHHIADFGEIEGISLMTIENFSTMKPEYKKVLKNLLGKKIFYIASKPDEIEDVLKFTGTRAIMLKVKVANVEEANKVLNTLEKTTAACCL